MYDYRRYTSYDSSFSSSSHRRALPDVAHYSTFLSHITNFSLKQMIKGRFLTDRKGRIVPECVLTAIPTYPQVQQVYRPLQQRLRPNSAPLKRHLSTYQLHTIAVLSVPGSLPSLTTIHLELTCKEHSNVTRLELRFMESIKSINMCETKNFTTIIY